MFTQNPADYFSLKSLTRQCYCSNRQRNARLGNVLIRIKKFSFPKGKLQPGMIWYWLYAECFVVRLH